MLFAGFDAGQTRTRCRISRWTTDGWRTICEGQGSGVRHLDAPYGVALFRDAVSSSLQDALGRRDAMELDAAVIMQLARFSAVASRWIARGRIAEPPSQGESP